MNDRNAVIEILARALPECVSSLRPGRSNELHCRIERTSVHKLYRLLNDRLGAQL